MKNKMKETVFNKFVREVIERIAVEAGQEVEFDHKELVDGKQQVLLEFDAVCPYGFADINGPVIFEIKVRSLKYDAIKAFRNRLRNGKHDYKYAKVVFIVNDWVDSIYIRDDRVIIWDLSKIEEWKKTYSIELFNATHSVEEISKKNSEKIQVDFIPDEKDFEDIKERFIIGLSADINNGAQLGLVLGAGVSIEQGASSWDTLLRDLKKLVQNSNLVDNADSLADKVGGSSLTTAQLCEDVFKNKEDFKWKIHEGLYPAGTGNIKIGTELDAISDLTDKYQSQKHFRILTYNFDDYLERYLYNKGIEYNVLSSEKDEYYKGKNKTVTFEMNGKEKNRFSIYHVHGFLPQAPNKSSLRGTICLTEADYNLLYNQPYSWPITSQMLFFRENTCLFVGCSLTDPNIRRLLELACIRDHWHYAIIKKDGLSNNDLMQANAHFYRLGIRIIWIDDYSEITSILKRI